MHFAFFRHISVRLNLVPPFLPFPLLYKFFRKVFLNFIDHRFFIILSIQFAFLSTFTHFSFLPFMATGNENASDFDAILIDKSHSLYLHRQYLESFQLTDKDNYGIRNIAIKIALQSKKKIRIIDGSYPKSEVDSQ